MVAFGTSADPAKMQQRLRRTWRKKWAKLCKKKARKVKMAHIATAVQEALLKHGHNLMVRDLRAIVGQELGVPLEGRRRLAFDKALFKLTAPTPRQRRPRRRFKLAARAQRKHKA